MPKRPCTTPGCPNFAVAEGKCQRHRRSRQLRRIDFKQVYNSKRWQSARRATLGICEVDGCNLVATDVHHITDLNDGGAPFDPDNLQGLCHAHHSEITRKGT